jgi:hypothetical protein
MDKGLRQERRHWNDQVRKASLHMRLRNTLRRITYSQQLEAFSSTIRTIGQDGSTVPDAASS